MVLICVGHYFQAHDVLSHAVPAAQSLSRV